MNVESFMPIVQGFLGGAVSAGVFKGPITSLEDWWYVNYGHDISKTADLLKVEREVSVEKLKRELLEEASKIKPENIKEPKLNILGPALEASRYFIEDEPLRIMFAKLIASSMDSSKDSYIHPSFVEIIKQMNPIDADNMLNIHLNGNEGSICEIKAVLSTGGYLKLYTNIYLGNPNQRNQSLIGPSLENLKRMGLIKIDYQEFYTNEAVYDIFKNTEEFSSAAEYIIRTNAEHDRTREINSRNPQITSTDLPVLTGPELQKGILKVTPYGVNFCAACL